MHDEDLLKLIADHMEGGFLENISDMFKHNTALYRFLPELISDERGRVRLGTVALVEGLREEHLSDIEAQVPHLALLLSHEDPVVRGDTAYLLGVIGGKEVLRHLREAEKTEKVDAIRQAIAETIEELEGGG
jgi:HEAT repeat protein